MSKQKRGFTRLTRRMCGGWGVVPGYELDTVRGMKAVVDRLAAYENTGLTPEEITAGYGSRDNEFDSDTYEKREEIDDET